MLNGLYDNGLDDVKNVRVMDFFKFFKQIIHACALCDYFKVMFNFVLKDCCFFSLYQLYDYDRCKIVYLCISFNFLSGLTIRISCLKSKSETQVVLKVIINVTKIANTKITFSFGDPRFWFLHPSHTVLKSFGFLFVYAGLLTWVKDILLFVI